jgi:rSAM/selenodomain-associated transferase 1
MQHAISDSFQRGYSHVVLIGSDLHDIRTSDLREAFRQLDHHDVVLGPAADGGYYLIGMKREFPRLFKKKAWGTGGVLKETLKDLEGTDVFLLPVRNDVDLYEDIEGNPVFESIIKQTHNE